MKAEDDGYLKHLATDGTEAEYNCWKIPGKEMGFLILIPIQAGQVPQIRAPPHPMLSPIIKRQWSCSHEPVSTTPCLSQAAWMSTFWPWYTAHPQPPSWENNPQCSHQDFIPNICCKCLKYPPPLGFLFLFFFKSNPQNLKYFESYRSAICEDATLQAQV